MNEKEIAQAIIDFAESHYSTVKKLVDLELEVYALQEQIENLRDGLKGLIK